MIIAIDFDGTCVTHEFPDRGKDIGAVPVLQSLVDNGHDLVLYTMRCNHIEEPNSSDPTITNIKGDYLADAIKWFFENDIPLLAIGYNPTQHTWTTSNKCYAHLYIDDAALGILSYTIKRLVTDHL